MCVWERERARRRDSSSPARVYRRRPQFPSAGEVGAGFLLFLKDWEGAVCVVVRLGWVLCGDFRDWMLLISIDYFLREV